jgi:hypothetical protein
MRVFKAKKFAQLAKDERLSDEALCQAAQEIVAGQVEADLGKGLWKKRIAKAGMGKSGGYRLIVAYIRPNSNRVFFLSMFGKNEKENLQAKEKEAFAIVAEAYIAADDDMIEKLKVKGSIFEICLI